MKTDGDASRALMEARLAGRSFPEVGLLGGDLCATLGGSGSSAHLRTPDARRFPIDLGVVTVDGAEFLFVAHVIAHRRAWRGQAAAVMNAQWRGDWDLGPKSHPNDGFVDVSQGRLQLSDRLKARKRVRTGTHVPHPAISVRRLTSGSITFDRPTPVWVDGAEVATTTTLAFEVIPDAFIAVI